MSVLTHEEYIAPLVKQPTYSACSEIQIMHIVFRHETALCHCIITWRVLSGLTIIHTRSIQRAFEGHLSIQLLLVKLLTFKPEGFATNTCLE